RRANTRHADGAAAGDSATGAGGTSTMPRGPARGTGRAGGGGNINQETGGSLAMAGMLPGTSGGSAGPRPRLAFGWLRELEVSECNSLQGIWGADLPELVRLSVTGCGEFTALDVWAPRLRRLALWGCPLLEGWSLREGNMASLQEAALNGCRQLSLGFLAKLIDHCRELRMLELVGAATGGGGGGGGGGGSWGGGGGSGGSRRDNPKADHGRINIKSTAALKNLERGRPKLLVVRTKNQMAAAVAAAREG
ncbi:unnamed protein product, partial [Phaeothamnion confervicola]